MTEIKDPILAAMEFSLNYTLKRFEDTETENGKIIREGIIRGKTLVEHLRIFGADVYGKSKERFAEDIKVGYSYPFGRNYLRRAFYFNVLCLQRNNQVYFVTYKKICGMVKELLY